MDTKQQNELEKINLNQHYPKAVTTMAKRDNQPTLGELTKIPASVSSSKKKQKKNHSVTTSIYHGKVIDKAEPYATERKIHANKTRIRALNASQSTKALPPVLQNNGNNFSYYDLRQDQSLEHPKGVKQNRRQISIYGSNSLGRQAVAEHQKYKRNINNVKMQHI